MLGMRERAIYGDATLEEINRELEELARRHGVQIEFFQSNHEGHIIDCIQAAGNRVDFLIINAGAFTHYSIAIHDAIRAVNLPVIEVHLSNPYSREDFRHRSLVSPVALGGIFGLGVLGYSLAVEAACRFIHKGGEKP